MNEEEVKDFGGLESSMTRMEGTEVGAEGHSAPQVGPDEHSVAASAPAQVEGSRYGCWVLGFFL
jgi:hypothetical protein